MGWPDTEAEWRVVHEAALVLGARREGQLLGQGALGLYAEQTGFRARLLKLGLVEKGINVEMSRGGALYWGTPQRFALATQAWC